MKHRNSLRRPTLAPGLLVLLLGACGTPGQNVRVLVPAAEVPLSSTLVAREMGRLLSADPRASKAAERRLTSLDAQGREALLAQAAKIPDERDPRWLHVLAENHALPDLPPEARLDFLLWEVSRDETFYVMKAQSRLLDLARADPDLMLQRVEKGGRGTEAVAVALALAGETRAVPPLLARYRDAGTVDERRAVAEALAQLAGEELRPRGQGTPRDIKRDADRIEAWYAARVDPVARPPAEEVEPRDG